MIWLGQLLLLLCVSAMTAVLAQVPNEGSYRQAVGEAQQLFADSRFTEVVDKLKPWADLFSDQAPLHHGVGLAYFQLGEFESAIPYLSTAVGLEDEGSAAWKQTVDVLGMAHFYQGAWHEAIPYLQRTISLDSADATRLYALATSLLHSGNHDGARGSYAELFQIQPNTPQAFLLTAHFLYQAAYRQAAETILLEALGKWPDFAEASYQLGIINVSKGDYLRASDYLEKVVQQNPRNALAWYYLGDARFRLSKLHEAVEALRRSIWLDERLVKSYLLLAEIHLRQANLIVAEDAVKQALKQDPQNYTANLLLARIYYKTNRNDLAKEQMGLVEELRANNVDQLASDSK